MLAVLIFMILLGCKRSNSEKTESGYKWNIVPDEIGLKLSDLSFLDSIHDNSSKFTLLTMIYGDCGTCNQVLDDTIYKQLPIKKVVFNVTEDVRAKLLSQILYAYGFPINYLFSGNTDLHSTFVGVPELFNNIDSVLTSGRHFYNDSINGVSRDSTQEMISYSLKAINSLKAHDLSGLKNNAQISLRKGSYFFNNYLLYLAYKIEDENLDSMRYYHTRALRHAAHGPDPHIYDNLIQHME